MCSTPNSARDRPTHSLFLGRCSYMTNSRGVLWSPPLDGPAPVLEFGFCHRSLSRRFEHHTWDLLIQSEAKSHVESVPFNRRAHRGGFSPYYCGASRSKIDLSSGLLGLCMLKLNGGLQIVVPWVDSSGHATRLQDYILARAFRTRIVDIVN
jgi:hypothetical protein